MRRNFALSLERFPLAGYSLQKYRTPSASRQGAAALGGVEPLEKASRLRVAGMVVEQEGEVKGGRVPVFPVDQQAGEAEAAGGVSWMGVQVLAFLVDRAERADQQVEARFGLVRLV